MQWSNFLIRVIAFTVIVLMMLIGWTVGRLMGL